MKSRPRGLKLCGAVFLGSFTLSVQATLIVYEGFNYLSGLPLPGQNGGSGWMGTWLGPNLGGTTMGSDQPFPIGIGLNWTNGPGYIAGVGNAIFDHSTNSYGDARQWFSPSAVTDVVTATWGTNIWFSCLARYDVLSTSGGIVVPFEDGFQALSGIGVTIKGGSGSLQVYIRQHGAEMSTNSVNYLQAAGDLSNVALIVGRIQLGPVATSPLTDPGNDRLDVWLNQTREPTNSSPLFMNGFSALRTAPYSQGYLVVRTGNDCQMTVDEIKVGTSFSDVVPPSAASDNPKPQPPLLSLAPAGPVGLQFNTAAGTTNHFNEVQTAAGIECSWVGQATPDSPVTYSFNITNGLAPGATNFLAYAWLIANPSGFIAGEVWNSNMVRLALQSDGHGTALATLGYKTNDVSGTSMFLASGFLCGITNAPFAGRWTISLTNDTDFTLTAPNGAHASGSMPGDVPGSDFQSGVQFYLGVNPKGSQNIGRFMTVSDIGIGITNAGVILYSDFTTGQPLDNSQWEILADDPASIFVMPSNSVYRASWRSASGAGVGPNSLTQTEALGGTAAWSALPAGIQLGDSTNVVFVTKDTLTNATGFFRISIPYSPY